MTLSREQMLIEMGISPIWVLREPGQTVVTAASEEAPERSISSADPDVPQMPAAQPIAEAPRVPVSPTAISGMDWPTLSKQVAECRLCPLCQQRKQAVLGVGDLNPDWLFIGEGPGADGEAHTRVPTRMSRASRLWARPASCSTTCWHHSTSPAATGSTLPMR